MAFVEDHTVFFRDDGFAVAATLGLDPITSGVIFDGPYLEALGNAVEGSGPVALAIAAEVPAVAQGDTLTIGATEYTVRGVEPDGTGLVLLRLEEA